MSFQDLVELGRERGGLGTDDLVTALLPLFREVAELHGVGLTAPLRGTEALVVDDRYRVHLDPAAAAPPVTEPARVAAVQREAPSAVEIVAVSAVHTDTGRGTQRVRPLDVALPGEELTRPVLVPGWSTWEHRLGHHDQLGDVACLGLLLAALACGLDLAVVEDVERLAGHRRNLFALNPRLHPVIATLAAEMLDPDRRRRPQDVAELAARLETYREQPVDLDLDAVTAGAAERDDRARAVLVGLRDRLHDLSRRNRLLYFRSTRQSLDLTEASVPLLLDVRNIRAEQLFTWRSPAAGRLLSGRPLALGSVLRWDDAPYAQAVLDTLIARARRDRSEYGRSQLRLVVAFLRWHDLRGDVEQRISSPLLLLPVTLTRKRGVRDSYLLTAQGTVAEVNPALRQHLLRLYGLELPEIVDLAVTPVERLYEDLAARIAASEPAVTLTLVDRPRIELVHRSARIRAAAFTRRQRVGRHALGGRVYAYSYRRRDYDPLGLKIFRDRVAPAPVPLGLALGEEPGPRRGDMVERGRETYVLDDHTEGNPYAWDVDLCALTLANVDHRTMSLVHDYNDLVAGGPTCAAFDTVFSLEPRPLEPAAGDDLPLEDRYLVVPADASQVAAVARARRGGSLVIQGPPGTGKSQTITNLIADYVAEGRRVLFICQKRAAIDVVHARLRQRGLDELTCLIHDSQADKKSFVHGLRRTYEAWLATEDDLAGLETARARVIAAIGAELDRVRGYEAALAQPGPGDGPTPRELLERLVDLGDTGWPEGDRPAVRRMLPTPAEWWAARPAVDAVATALTSRVSPRARPEPGTPAAQETRSASGTPAEPVLATSPVRFLAQEVLATVRPDAEAAAGADRARQVVRRLLELLDEPRSSGAFDGPEWPDATGSAGLTLPAVEAVGELGGLALPMARLGRSAALDLWSPEAARLRADAETRRQALERVRAAERRAAGWHDPLEPDDARAALGVALAREGSPLRFLDRAWRRVRRAVRSRYAVPGSAVRPTVSGALRLLVTVQEERAEADRLVTASRATWGHDDPAELVDRLDALRRSEDRRVLAVIDALARGRRPGLAAGFEQAGAEAARLREALSGLLVDVEDLPLDRLLAVLDALADPAAAAGLRALVPLRALDEHPPSRTPCAG